MTKMVIIPQGVCADRILVEIEGGVLRHVEFEGGCEGNGKALGRLLEGMEAAKAIELLRGIDCEGKGTSCADQFSHGLKDQMAPLPEKSEIRNT
jgi:uncharacterized protein (TIGR03905 family)